MIKVSIVLAMGLVAESVLRGGRLAALDSRVASRAALVPALNSWCAVDRPSTFVACWPDRRFVFRVRRHERRSGVSRTSGSDASAARPR